MEQAEYLVALNTNILKWKEKIRRNERCLLHLSLSNVDATEKDNFELLVDDVTFDTESEASDGNEDEPIDELTGKKLSGKARKSSMHHKRSLK